jgi:hypothetical protein
VPGKLSSATKWMTNLIVRTRYSVVACCTKKALPSNRAVYP